MNKETIELERDKDWLLGYGKMYDYFWTETEILNKIVEWSKDKNVKIYKHLMRLEYEFADGTFYKPEIPGFVAGNGEKCDRVRFLDIYYQ